jgi:hypothetical protein
MAGRSVDATWAWCAPTETSVVAEPACVSTGGAALVPLPWQELQLIDTSGMPFTCSDTFTVEMV